MTVVDALGPAGGSSLGGMVAAMIARPVRSIIIVVLVVAVGVGLWLWTRAGSSTPVSEETALADAPGRRAATGADR